MGSLLEVRDLHVAYGGVQALRGVSLDLNEGEIVTIIGANGAGKSTLLNAVSNLVKAQSGEILYEGMPLPAKPYMVVAKGLIQVPEGRQVFANLTVKGNLAVGAFLRKDKDNIKKDMDYVFSTFPRLEERQNQMAGSLSGGEQQMLAMGRALMSKPKALLLDEPSLGLAPIMVQEIFKVINKINKEGTPILLVEQNAHRALEIAHRAYVLEVGQIIREGKGVELLNDPVVQEAYLGTKSKTKSQNA
ncbi:MAG TPA: ABC transporter ATP-binding protein [Holophaga sp.]|nr:ABC transporter ATP-binding protein [Holophaga sp.]HPS66916.1 ABC transporter ATP-binding protein [Holophaga sp.]